MKLLDTSCLCTYCVYIFHFTFTHELKKLAQCYYFSSIHTISTHVHALHALLLLTVMHWNFWNLTAASALRWIGVSEERTLLLHFVCFLQRHELFDRFRHFFLVSISIIFFREILQKSTDCSLMIVIVYNLRS